VLESAGLTFLCDPAAIDETGIISDLRNRGTAVTEVAKALAKSKAEVVAGRQTGALVIGADQIMECEGKWYQKPSDHAAAAAQLRELSGRTHRLVSAVCVVRDGQLLWQHVETPRLTIRRFSDRFLDEYLERAGSSALESVGSYRLEGLGAQLFSAIEGDYFSILGLPLLPLLTFLRSQGVVGD